MKKILLSVLCFSFIFLFGCGQTTSSSNALIYNPETIDTISVDFAVDAKGTMKSTKITNQAQIQQILKILKGIELKKMSEAEVKEVFNPDVYFPKIKCNLLLVAAKNDKDQNKSKGIINVFKDGNLVFVDPNILGPFADGKAKDPGYYISTEKQVNTVDQIMKIINENKGK